jgi:NADPH:quinone reductase-like Zn-dependent oxidoreductase
MKAWQYDGTSARALTARLESSLALNVHASSPEPTSLRPSQVLVQVVSAALNHIDYKLPESDILMKAAAGLPRDSQPGVDFSGRVVDKHPSCKEFTKGQRVFGSLARPAKWGALGQLLVASTSELIALPDGVGFDEAAALGVAAGIAYKALENLPASAHVFVNGGSGSVGSFAVQLAKLFGASKVVATASGANVPLVQELGAERVVNYQVSPDIVADLEADEPFDLIIDAAGVPVSLFAQVQRILHSDGTYVQIAAYPTSKRMMPVLMKTIRSSFGGPRFRFVKDNGSRDNFHRMVQWMKEGKLRSVIGQVFEFDKVPGAYAKLREGMSGGRVIVHVE